MTISAGTEIYNADTMPVMARGATYTDAELDAALSGSGAEVVCEHGGMANLSAEGLHINPGLVRRNGTVS